MEQVLVITTDLGYSVIMGVATKIRDDDNNIDNSSDKTLLLCSEIYAN